MKYEFDSDIKWTKGVKTTHRINVDLDLALDDVLEWRNLAISLQTQEQEIRREIANLVLGQILPKIIDSTGLEHETLEDLEVESHIDNKSEASIGIPTLPETTLFIRDRMRLTIDMTATRPVNAMQALYVDRGGVASEIANDIMKYLKRAILHVDDDKTSTEYSMRGNEFKELKHKVKRSSADQN